MTVKLLIKYFNVRMVGFRTEWHYDSWNRLLDMTYHDGETVYYTYNTAGQLLKMAGNDNYIDDILYDIFGNRLQLSYGNGATQEYLYDNMLRLSRTRLSTLAEGQIKDITYTYDAIGNIVSQNNQRNALPNGLGGVSLQTEDRHTFTGKELDAESNLYYYDARYNSSTYSQFTSPDPMSDKLPNFNPYLYCAGNPIRFVDPTGMHPIYDTEGNLLETDDKGLQGEAIIMKSGDFKLNMSSEVSLKNNLGIGKLSPEGKQKFDESYAGLSYRPDWDGKITFDEAKAWYQAGSGQPLYADFSQIEIHDFLINEKQLNKNEGLLCNLFFFSSDIESMCIYGTITLIKDENHPLNFIPNSDTYNFEMHHCTWKEPVECFRNILTKFGKNINGEGNPFKIHFYGLQTKNQLLLKIL